MGGYGRFRRLHLQLQCSYPGQQGDVSQSVDGNMKFVDGNASAYQVKSLSPISGEGRVWGGVGEGGRG